MSSKELDTLAVNNQKAIRILGHEYKVYTCGTIIDLYHLSALKGNILESKELSSKYHQEILTLSLLTSSTDTTTELTELDFKASERKLYYFYQTLNHIEIFANEHRELNDIIALHGRIIKPDLVDGIKEAFVAGLNDNFNTSSVIAEFQRVFKYCNSLLNNANENPLHKLTTLKRISNDVIKLANLLGIFLEEPGAFIFDLREKYIEFYNIDTEEVRSLINKRKEAKANKNYNLADEIKVKLDQKGIIIQDSAFGSEWDIKELFD